MPQLFFSSVFSSPQLGQQQQPEKDHSSSRKHEEHERKRKEIAEVESNAVNAEDHAVDVNSESSFPQSKNHR